MITDRNKFNIVTICCWLSCLSAAQALAIQNSPSVHNQFDQEANNRLQDATVRNFSPRVDYNNEWRPVGRGDPLKNDPTYDYSPPALERVRYWADSSSDKDGSNKDVSEDAGYRKTNTSKNEILLLGVAHDQRVRGGNPQQSSQQSQHMAKNGKGETPLLQPKYTSIRRSYYAHQLPTHLMPPPMQTILSSTIGMSTHSKPYYYSTAATSPWTHTSSTSTAHQQHQHHTPPSHMYDSHHQESVNYLSYTRPGTTTSMQQGEYYSPNAIRPSQNSVKQITTAPRKPWVHELLQKELIKPMVAKPTMPPATKYLMGSNTRPIYEFKFPVGISTTFTPVEFTASTTQTPRPYTSSPIYITSAKPTTTTTRATSTTTTLSPTLSSTRLLIPETSNLAFRPTVAAPLEMTTDSLFSHYNQPEKPLVGPMYLIIEGHSKVKTYGKNELDPHQPKIVPIIPKREPVVRIGDPNEKRGTVETFQVKHLHTKLTTTTPLPPTTPRSTTTTAHWTASTVKPKTTTTVHPKANVSPTDEPPTGMQGLLSLFDIFQDEPSAVELKAPPPPPNPLNTRRQQDKIYVTTTGTTILKPITTTTTVKPPPSQLPHLDARVSSKADTITSIVVDGNVDDESEAVTTEPAPREVRQVFDYDQLPESRFKELADASSFEEADSDDSAGDLWLRSTYDDDDVHGEEATAADNDDEYEDESPQLIKRIDKLVDDAEDEEEFEEMDLEEDEPDNFGLAARTKTT